MGVICNYAAKFQSDTSYSFFVIAAEKNNKKNNNNNNQTKYSKVFPFGKGKDLNNNQTKYIKVFPLEKGKTLITIPEVNLNEHRH